MVDFVKPGEGDSSPKKKKYKFNFKRFFLILLIFYLLSSLVSTLTYNYTPKIAVVPIQGSITVGKDSSLLGGESASSREISNTLRSLVVDDSVKGILLDINSGGGSAVASEELGNAILYAKQFKPVYAVISDVGASGAFWAAVSANKVYTSKISLVGSIGVTMASLSYEDVLKEYNITYRKITAGKYKDIGSPYRKITPYEEKMFQDILDETHQVFIEHVAISRNLSIEQVTPWAEGQIILGSKAKELGFVDELGGYDDALNDLKQATDNSSMVVIYGTEKTLAEELGLSTPSLVPKAEAFGLQFK